MDYKELARIYRSYAARFENGEQLLLGGEIRIQDALREAATAIETLLAERDAAMEEIRNMGCETCKHKMVDQVKCYNCFATGGWRDNWEWHGPKGG